MRRRGVKRMRRAVGEFTPAAFSGTGRLIKGPSTRMQARTKILSRCLVVIEMAFAAVYSAHAARHRQKGFELAANFLGANGGGKKGERQGMSEGGEGLQPVCTIFRPLRVHARLYPRGHKWLCGCQRFAKQEETAFAWRTHRRRYPTILNTTCEGYMNTLYLTSIFL